MTTTDLAKLAKACRLWNRLTDPHVYLTDRAHNARRVRASMIWRAYLAPNLASLREWSNGTLSVDCDDQVSARNLGAPRGWDQVTS